MNDYSSLNDSELDAAFAAYFDANDFTSANIIGHEIVIRETSVLSFVGGLFGQSRFPLYEARTGFFQASAAQSSVSASVSNVAAGVGTSVLGISTPIIVLLIAGGIFLYMGKK